MLIRTQREAIGKIAPYGQDIKSLQKSIDEMKKIIEKSEKEVKEIEQKYNYIYEEHLDKLKRLVPVEAIAKLTNLTLGEIGPTPRNVKYQAPTIV